MSKTALKKELQSMTKEQVIQIVLDAYQSNAEFKEYFNFFLNPDIPKLLSKFEDKIIKELNRSKWGSSKARTSVIKKLLKDFSGFNPGPEAILDLMLAALNYIGQAERYLNFTETQIKYVVTLTKQILVFANSNLMFANVIPRLEGLMASPGFTVYFRQNIKNGMIEAGALQ